MGNAAAWALRAAAAGFTVDNNPTVGSIAWSWAVSGDSWTLTPKAANDPAYGKAFYACWRGAQRGNR